MRYLIVKLYTWYIFNLKVIVVFIFGLLILFGVTVLVILVYIEKKSLNNKSEHENCISSYFPHTYKTDILNVLASLFDKLRPLT